MKTTLSVCITVIGLCLLIASSSFADGGGVKKVDEKKDPGINKYCEDNLKKYESCNKGDVVAGYFKAYKGPSIFTADVFLTGNHQLGQSTATKHYFISVTTNNSLALCDYTPAELMKRYQDYACKRKVDKDFGYNNVYPVVTDINVGNKANCLRQNMLTGTIVIRMCQ